jgi:hypothetical protein
MGKNIFHGMGIIAPVMGHFTSIDQAINRMSLKGGQHRRMKDAICHLSFTLALHAAISNNLGTERGIFHLYSYGYFFYL